MSTQQPTPNNTDLSLEQAISELPYLGDIQVVTDILGAAQGEMIDRLVALSKNEINKDVYSKQTVDQAQKLARLFLGQEPGYSLLRDWNDPEGQLAPFVKEQAEIEEDDQHAIMTTFFVTFLIGAIQAAMMMDNGEEDDAKSLIDVNSEQTAGILIGLSYYEYGADGIDQTTSTTDTEQ